MPPGPPPLCAASSTWLAESRLQLRLSAHRQRTPCLRPEGLGAAAPSCPLPSCPGIGSLREDCKEKEVPDAWRLGVWRLPLL